MVGGGDVKGSKHAAKQPAWLPLGTGIKVVFITEPEPPPPPLPAPPACYGWKRGCWVSPQPLISADSPICGHLQGKALPRGSQTCNTETGGAFWPILS